MIRVVHTEYADDTRTTVQVVKEREIPDFVQASNARKVWEFCNRHFGFGLATQERMVALLTDNKLQVRNVQIIGIGVANSIQVSTRDVLITAFNTAASGIILAHCHPSGDPTPSGEDCKFTEAMKQSAAICGLKLHDHIICTEDHYYSYFEQGGL